MSPENPNPPKAEKDQPGEKRELGDFRHRPAANSRWPKPNDEALAAAIEAIQRMSGGVAGAELTVGDTADPGNVCSECGGLLPAGARFCVWCGMPKESAAVEATGALPPPRAA